jgi:hemerythrin superfamily protein
MEILRILSRMASSDEEYDALDLLRQDHAVVAELFERYENLDDGDGKEKRDLISRIIRALTVHARIEEELLYPALRQAIGDQAVMEKADVEHAMIRSLMADLHRTDVDASHFDAKVKSLAQLVQHHVEEEEAQMFQDARDSNLNLVAMGGQLDAYRAALESRYELDTDGRDLEAFLTARTVLELTASHTLRPTGRPAAKAAARKRGKPRRAMNTISTSQRRRARRSSRPATEASKGEST